jgi:hypothetical protein
MSPNSGKHHSANAQHWGWHPLLNPLMSPALPPSGLTLIGALQMIVFRVFCLGYVSDRASFTITKIEAYKKNFGFITPRNGIYNFEGVESQSLRLCLLTRARFATFIQNQLKIYKNYRYWTNILRKFEEMKQLHYEQKRAEVSFKIP